MPDAGPVWLDAEIVLELNRQVLRFSDETPGVRGGTRLEAITEKHVFRGGNKRTSVATAAVFLRLNGLDIEATLPPTGTSGTFDDEAFEYIVALSTGEIDADAFGDWLSSLTRKQS